jgi:drug/metabolite transporter (DMT)-like permease
MLLFFLVLFVIARWTASATAYAFVLFPVVAVAAGALLEGQRVSLTFLAGTALVMVGVYVGALHGQAKPASPGAPGPVYPPPAHRP